jgi:hypothetical protein
MSVLYLPDYRTPGGHFVSPRRFSFDGEAFFSREMSQFDWEHGSTAMTRILEKLPWLRGVGAFAMAMVISGSCWAQGSSASTGDEAQRGLAVTAAGAPGSGAVPAVTAPPLEVLQDTSNGGFSPEQSSGVFVGVNEFEEASGIKPLKYAV